MVDTNKPSGTKFKQDFFKFFVLQREYKIN